MTKNRFEYFDFLRGLAIIGVVFIHTYYPYSIMGITFRQLINCSVPIFLFISGYFMFTKDVSNKSNYFNFLINQSLKIYIPMLIWTAFFLLEMNLLYGKEIKCGLHSVFGYLSGRCVFPFYFIILIIQYYTLLPFFKKIATKKGLIFSLIFSMVFISIWSYLFNVLIPGRTLVVTLAPFPILFTSFITGLYLRKLELNNKYSEKDKLHILSLKYLIPLSFIFLILSISEIKYIRSIFDESFLFELRPISTLYTFFFILLLYKLKDYYKTNIIYNHISKIGNASFGIFLSHIILMKFFGAFFNSKDLGFPFYSIFILYASYIIIVISRKILPAKVIKYIGFF